MDQVEPPTLPRAKSRFTFFAKVLLGLGVFGLLLVAGLVVLRIAGWLIPFRVPTGAMAPAVAPGDMVLMEGLSYRSAKPRRGDIVVFRTEGLGPMVPADQVWLKRVVGLPGEEVRIDDGRLFINGRLCEIANAQGVIRYLNQGRGALLRTTPETVVVPSGRYLVLGDNSANSLDSRYWGFLPEANICGRVFFCYAPGGRIGRVR